MNDHEWTARVEGLTLDELRAAIATADYHKPDWLDEYRRNRDKRMARRIRTPKEVERYGREHLR